MFWILNDVQWCPTFEIYWMELDGLRRWKTLCWQSWQTQVWWLQEAKQCRNERAEASSHCITCGIGFSFSCISHGNFILFPLPPLRQRAEKDWTFPIWCSDAWQNPDTKVLGQKAPGRKVGKHCCFSLHLFSTNNPWAVVCSFKTRTGNQLASVDFKESRIFVQAPLHFGAPDSFVHSRHVVCASLQVWWLRCEMTQYRIEQWKQPWLLVVTYIYSIFFLPCLYGSSCSRTRKVEDWVCCILLQPFESFNRSTPHQWAFAGKLLRYGFVIIIANLK